MFIERLSVALQRQGVDVEVIAHAKPFKLSKALLTRQKTLFILNSMRPWFVYAAASLIARSSRIALFDHNHSRNHPPNGTRRREWRKVAKKTTFFICNQRLVENYSGVVASCDLETFTPFIVPDASRESEQLSKFSRAIVDKMVRAESVIITSAGKNGRETNGTETYGISDILDLAEDLLIAKPGALVVLAIAELQAADEYLVARSARLSNVLLINEKHEVWPLLRFCNVYLRATVTDGDSVSVREALHFGLTVIATDLPGRPEGCKTYPKGDRAELLRLCLFAISGEQSPRVERTCNNPLPAKLAKMAIALTDGDKRPSSTRAFLGRPPC